MKLLVDMHVAKGALRKIAIETGKTGAPVVGPTGIIMLFI